MDALFRYLNERFEKIYDLRANFQIREGILGWSVVEIRIFLPDPEKVFEVSWTGKILNTTRQWEEIWFLFLMKIQAKDEEIFAPYRKKIPMVAIDYGQLEAGYQVKKGARSSGRNAKGVPTFTRDQVMACIDNPAEPCPRCGYYGPVCKCDWSSKQEF